MVSALPTLMGEGFNNFFYFWLRSSRYEKDFCKFYQNYLGHLCLQFFIFQMSGRWFPWHPPGRGPSIKYVRFREWLGSTTKSIFLSTRVGGGRSNSVFTLLKKIDYEYIDNQRVVPSLIIISKTYSKQWRP